MRSSRLVQIAISSSASQARHLLHRRRLAKLVRTYQHPDKLQFSAQTQCNVFFCLLFFFKRKVSDKLKFVHRIPLNIYRNDFDIEKTSRLWYNGGVKKYGGDIIATPHKHTNIYPPFGLSEQLRFLQSTLDFGAYVIRSRVGRA